MRNNSDSTQPQLLSARGRSSNTGSAASQLRSSGSNQRMRPHCSRAARLGVSRRPLDGVSRQYSGGCSLVAQPNTANSGHQNLDLGKEKTPQFFCLKTRQSVQHFRGLTSQHCSLTSHLIRFFLDSNIYTNNQVGSTTQNAFIYHNDVTAATTTTTTTTATTTTAVSRSSFRPRRASGTRCCRQIIVQYRLLASDEVSDQQNDGHERSTDPPPNFFFTTTTRCTTVPTATTHPRPTLPHFQRPSH
ncbi:hypothetical protein B0H10DRAFT_641120 [Mycena sp. CBHHK59/15]|nr:hypothetical protein B0H10DRAFT_641120 [Mycena sp. CBHHK59/15]